MIRPIPIQRGLPENDSSKAEEGPMAIESFLQFRFRNDRQRIASKRASQKQLRESNSNFSPIRLSEREWNNLGWPYFRGRPGRLPGMDGAPNLGHWEQRQVLSKLKTFIWEMVSCWMRSPWGVRPFFTPWIMTIAPEWKWFQRIQDGELQQWKQTLLSGLC
jgi:hypothetical protein